MMTLCPAFSVSGTPTVATDEASPLDLVGANENVSNTVVVETSHIQPLVSPATAAKQ